MQFLGVEGKKRRGSLLAAAAAPRPSGVRCQWGARFLVSLRLAGRWGSFPGTRSPVEFGASAYSNAQFTHSSERDQPGRTELTARCRNALRAPARRDDDGKESRDFFLVGFSLPRSLAAAITNSGARAWRPLSRGGMLFAMAEAIGLESLRWKGLVLLSVAQLTVVHDASIADVALGA
jgi:hypothetical protein